MLFGFLLTIFVFICILMVLVILVQKGKSGTGIGGLGGGSQMIFGATGGQDIFQKTTWVLGTLFLLGALLLFLMKSTQYKTSRYLDAAHKAALQKPGTDTDTEK